MALLARVRRVARLDTNTHELAALDKRVTELKNGFAKRTAEAETLRQVGLLHVLACGVFRV